MFLQSKRSNGLTKLIHVPLREPKPSSRMKTNAYYIQQSLLLHTGRLLAHFSHHTHELTSTNSRQDMPPTVKLKDPRPRKSDPRSKISELGAKLEVNVPDEVSKQADKGRRPDSDGPLVCLLLRKARLEPVQDLPYSNNF